MKTRRPPLKTIPKLTRRQFVKASGATAATLALTKFIAGGPWKPLLQRAEAQTAAGAEKLVPTTCWIGKQDCGMLARVVDGRIVKLEGHPENARNWGKLCVKGVAQIATIYDPYRVKAPLKRTNGKGVPGEWKEISWEEAFTLVGEKVKEVRERDKRLLIWQKGRSKTEPLYDNAFVNATGAYKMGHGAYCSDAAYRAVEYTIGQHAGLHPDFRHCNYLLAWGWNMTNAGGNKTCWLTWNQQFVEARERGMKVVTIDPRRRGVGPHTDEWLPIKPGTDLAFFLALANVLVARGTIDRKFLASFTNAPFLVKSDALFLKVDGKEQVWDEASKSAKPFDAKGITPALEGSYTAGGSTVRTAFEVYKEHIAKYTPEWAAPITDITAETTRRIGEEMGENARIGSTIVLDGIELPYRPVGLMAYHVSQQEFGFQAFYAAINVYQLLGAVEAVGGLRADYGRSIYGNFKSLNEIKIKDPPYDIMLKTSKYFPINTGSPSIAALSMLDPAKWGVDYTPEVMILHHTNPLLSFPPQDVFIEAYKKLKFIAAIDPFMSETADFFADVVLPAATIEKYEGPISASTQYHGGTTLRVPPIPPLFQSKGDIDIYIGIAEKAGVLYGKGGYVDQINSQLNLKDPYKLDLNARPESRDIFDRWAMSNGYEEGVAFFEREGMKKASPVAIKNLYLSGMNPPHFGVRYRLYGESLKQYQDTMKQKGVSETFWRGYYPLPTWAKPTFEGSPPEYDLLLTSHKKIEFKQSRAAFVSLLNELEPEQRVEINTRTARAKGIRDNDVVWVESHNAVTGQTKKLKAKAVLVEGLRPDTVSMSHHYGMWVHPWAKDKGPTPNSLFFTGEGYVAMSADQTYLVRVKVTRA
ncbi:MAG: molybdopterin-dependent oxidoreductase [Chloroflexi bacterium]|nr:molybdopterin-dependent oxidoreductase [Chloroflexota bacterium]